MPIGMLRQFKNLVNDEVKGLNCVRDVELWRIQSLLGVVMQSTEL